MSKTENIRRQRLGDLQKLLRSRCGPELPDGDAGREYLYELLLPISLGPEPVDRMLKAVEVWAPWSTDEGRQLIDQINRMPVSERKVDARRLGERLRVTNRERELLRLRTINPSDLTDKQLKELRRAKDRARKQQARRLAGSKPHAASLARLKPWATKDISRRTWFRKQAKRRGTNSSAKLECHRGTNSSAVNLSNSRGRTSATEKAERMREVAEHPNGGRRREGRQGRQGRHHEGRKDSTRLSSLVARLRASRTKRCQPRLRASRTHQSH